MKNFRIFAFSLLLIALLASGGIVFSALRSGLDQTTIQADQRSVKALRFMFDGYELVEEFRVPAWRVRSTITTQPFLSCDSKNAKCSGWKAPDRDTLLPMQILRDMDRNSVLCASRAQTSAVVCIDPSSGRGMLVATRT